MFNAEEQRDMMLMIGGQKPLGQPICKTNWPRGCLSPSVYNYIIPKFLPYLAPKAHAKKSVIFFESLVKLKLQNLGENIRLRCR